MNNHNRKANGQLAIFGGSKTIQRDLNRYNPIGSEEIKAVNNVMEGGVLSKFLGVWHHDFEGGPKVREFERSLEEYFQVRHAVVMNSLTSGLISAIGAIGIEPGDEVIVSPWTMCASATAILHWNAIPVFADIIPSTFCLDPQSVESNISPHTKAILATDIFGHSADIDSLRSISKKYGLKLISDAAQSPGGLYKGHHTGTLADVGGFSLNYHKHIHTGEGGIMVTNDDEIADRMKLIRNHAEAIVGDKGTTNLSNMIGYNFRLGEIECAIGIEQLKKLPNIIKRKQEMAERLSAGLNGLSGLKTPTIQDDCTHVYYMYPIVIECSSLGIERNPILSALTAEGVPGLTEGYQNIHLLPMYQHKIAYGSLGFPWSGDICKRDISYKKGICPVAETLHDRNFVSLAMCMYDFSNDDIDDIISAFKKVWDNLSLLKQPRDTR